MQGAGQGRGHGKNVFFPFSGIPSSLGGRWKRVKWIGVAWLGAGGGDGLTGVCPGVNLNPG